MASQRGFHELAQLLRPRADLATMFPDVQPQGPPTLRALAAAAARGMLEGQLEALRQQEEQGEEGEEGQQGYMQSAPVSAPVARPPEAGVPGAGAGDQEPPHLEGTSMGRNGLFGRLSDPGAVQPSPPSCCSSDGAHTCGVCLDARVAVTPSGCCHGLCHSCAARLVAGIQRDLPGCPFCRAPIKAWRRAD